ncbi:hypothetical protein [Ligilactobacillus saerimneri]|uniref:hypothetical protein n=1 Tax=Ligilactobacillus saerimneri TaxID=228229 RepID=UPI0024BAA93B|nr:hypothetical protein [Ligilactobacillus saerimneri]
MELSELRGYIDDIRQDQATKNKLAQVNLDALETSLVVNESQQQLISIDKKLINALKNLDGSAYELVKDIERKINDTLDTLTIADDILERIDTATEE